MIPIGAAVVIGVLIVGVLVIELAAARCEGWVKGWRVGYDKGFADAEAGRRPDPSRPQCW